MTAVTPERGEGLSGSCKVCNSPRPASPCWKCGGEVKPIAEGWEWPGLTDIDRIRELAREVGYAVGVHGSQQRDQDLIAAPWVESAVTPLELAQHIAAGLGGRVVDYERQDKPCGRWSCNIHTPDWTKLIDLSVMPPRPAPSPATDEVVAVLRALADAYECLCGQAGMNYHESPSSHYARARSLLAKLEVGN